MKKNILISVLMSAVLLTACSSKSSISEEQYNAAISEKNIAIQERDAAIQERNTAIQERNTAIQERDSAIQEKESALANTTTDQLEEPKNDTLDNNNVSDSTDSLEKLEIKQLKWKNNQNYHNDLLITNNSETTLRIDISMLFHDDKDNIIGTASDTIYALGPGQTKYMILFNDTSFASSTYEVQAEEDKTYNSTKDVSFTANETDNNKIIVSVTNNGDEPVSFAKCYVLYYKGKKVINYDYTYTIDSSKELKPGKTEYAEFKTPKDYTSFEVFLDGYCKQ